MGVGVLADVGVLETAEDFAVGIEVAFAAATVVVSVGATAVASVEVAASAGGSVLKKAKNLTFGFSFHFLSLFLVSRNAEYLMTLT